MFLIQYDIVPKQGLGTILFGARKSYLRKKLGVPDAERPVSYLDRDGHELIYEFAGLILRFSTYDDLRLDWISTNHNYTSLKGYELIGMQESTLVECKFSDLGPPVPDCLQPNPEPQYYWPNSGLNCTVQHGIVASATLSVSREVLPILRFWPD